MNKIRLSLQWILFYAIARPLKFSHKLVQICDRCGRGKSRLSFWADNSVWEMVVGNANGHRHGCFCVECFDLIARKKGICLYWKPIILLAEKDKQAGGGE